MEIFYIWARNTIYHKLWLINMVGQNSTRDFNCHAGICGICMQTITTNSLGVHNVFKHLVINVQKPTHSKKIIRINLMKF